VDRALAAPDRQADVTHERDIDLLDTYNLRDLGGYAAAGGYRVRWRRLFRGAGLHRLRGADVVSVRALGLRTAIDLRTSQELTERGAFPVDELPATAHHLPMITRMWDHGDLRADDPPEHYLVARYREMFDEGREAIVATLRILSRPESYPAAFYCAAGKDRTGVLAALVLSAVGVDDDEIVADYHLSSERVARIVERARARGDGEADSLMLSQPTALIAAPPQAMRLLLAWVAEEHGSVTGYLEGLGVGPATIAGMRASLLERAPS
jgi:protein-tyrosine phosphatase